MAALTVVSVSQVGLKQEFIQDWQNTDTMNGYGLINKLSAYRQLSQFVTIFKRRFLNKQDRKSPRKSSVPFFALFIFNSVPMI